jgi:TonB family protein
MFESVAPETFQARSRKVFYETLPLSLAVHAIAIGAGVVIASWNIVFPAHSPRLNSVYSLATIPDPPPPPPLPPAGQPQPRPIEKPVAVAEQIVAPTVIPDLIPQIPDPPPPTLQLAPAPGPPLPGVPEGSDQGKIGGEIGGDLRGVSGGITFPDDGRVHISLNESLPLLPLAQDYPLYPDEAKKKQLEDQVVVRYVIGKNGRVTDVQILDHAREPMFDKVTVEAIRQWRFRPMIKDGKPVEVVKDLAVNFQLIRH